MKAIIISDKEFKLLKKIKKEFHSKEKRARENLLFFVDLYNRGIITKDLIAILLPRKDAEAVIIGSKTGKEAVNIEKRFDS